MASPLPVSYRHLLDEWEALLARRPSFREPLAPYASILEVWARWPDSGIAPLAAGAEECRDRWRRGIPLLAEAPPAVRPEALEDLLGPVLDCLASLGTETEALERFAQAWDRGDVRPSDLFPGKGRVGSASAQAATGLSQECLGFLACASLRPVLEPYLAGCRIYGAEASWDLGICPFCGAPPGFEDFGEDGQRRLACHLCGGSWTFPRLQCPHCGSRNAHDLVRLQAEAREEGYVIDACRACAGYLKGLDRRVRWNAGSALVEDWGSPHLDLVAERAEYWRALPTLIQLQRPAE